LGPGRPAPTGRPSHGEPRHQRADAAGDDDRGDHTDRQHRPVEVGPAARIEIAAEADGEPGGEAHRSDGGDGGGDGHAHNVGSDEA
jgi:hypothetical protein